MEKKVQKWLESGLIDDETASKMLEEIKIDKEKSARTKINIAIYTISAILLGTGIITFISANEWLIDFLNSNRFLKMFSMIFLTFASFFGGYHLAYEKKNFPKLGNSLIFLSTILIGGVFALIGQIYNTNANTAPLFFVWLLCVLPVAYIFKSNTINVLSIILTIIATIFFYAELEIDENLIWTVFIPIFTGSMLYSIGNIKPVLEKFNSFSLSYKITGACSIFMTLFILICSVEKSYNTTSLYYLVPILFLIGLNIFNYVSQKEQSKLLKIETILISALLIFLLSLLIPSNVSKAMVMIVANLFIVSMISIGFHYGYKFENEKIISVTNKMLMLFITINYCRWGWSYMDKTLFFMFGGGVLLLLGLYLENQKKEITKKGK